MILIAISRISSHSWFPRSILHFSLFSLPILVDFQGRLGTMPVAHLSSSLYLILSSMTPQITVSVILCGYLRVDSLNCCQLLQVLDLQHPSISSDKGNFSFISSLFVLALSSLWSIWTISLLPFLSKVSLTFLNLFGGTLTKIPPWHTYTVLENYCSWPKPSLLPFFLVIQHVSLFINVFCSSDLTT